MRELRESIIDGSLPQFVAAFLQVRPAVSSAVSAAVSPPFLHRFSAVFVHSLLARSYLHPQRMYPTGEVPPWAAEALTIAGIPTSTVATAGEGPMIHQAQCAAFSVLLFQCALFSVPHHSVPSFSALFLCRSVKPTPHPVSRSVRLPVPSFSALFFPSSALLPVPSSSVLFVFQCRLHRPSLHPRLLLLSHPHRLPPPQVRHGRHGHTRRPRTACTQSKR